MTTEVEDDDVCETCRQTWGWHKENTPKHSFVPKDDDGRPLRAAAAESAAGEGVPPGPDPAAIHKAMTQSADPVVRALLVHKGLVTPEELSDFQAMMVEGLSGSGAMVFSKNYASTAERRQDAGNEGGGQPGDDRPGDPPDRNGTPPE